ncbi:hypothetical protein K523DRAFT_86655 [Schizophyllum commune Tattone D]|nr:hypothetical protein K523DRAFT_86655 [Schizophyllum commune Tattone D]
MRATLSEGAPCAAELCCEPSQGMMYARRTRQIAYPAAVEPPTHANHAIYWRTRESIVPYEVLYANVRASRQCESEMIEGEIDSQKQGGYKMRTAKPSNYVH